MVPQQTATLIAGLCLLALAARAEALSSETVSRFMASMEALQASDSFSEHFQPAWEAGRQGREFPGSLLPSELLTMMEGREGYGAFRAVIKAHGFDRPQTWARAGDRALLALMSLDVADKVPALQARLLRMHQQVDASPNFSDAQKRRLQQMIDSTSDLFDRVAQVSPTDRDVVRPHREALTKALDYQTAR
jgi:hypothetical protein